MPTKSITLEVKNAISISGKSAWNSKKEYFVIGDLVRFRGYDIKDAIHNSPIASFGWDVEVDSSKVFATLESGERLMIDSITKCGSIIGEPSNGTGSVIYQEKLYRPGTPIDWGTNDDDDLICRPESPEEESEPLHTKKEKQHQGLRYNSGKLRLDLLNPIAIKGITGVLTAGANKYEDRNWEKGMSWGSVMASLKRHLIAIEEGEDFDAETGLLHIDHVQCGAHFLSTFYHTYPQGDDRDHWFKRPTKRVFLDIDGVLADFETHFITKLGLPDYSPNDWNDYRFRNNFESVKEDQDFWGSIPALIDSAELSYPIAGYVTSRPIVDHVTTWWLSENRFPKGEFYNTYNEGSKVQQLLAANCDVFVDDSIHNFMECQAAGITCFLMTRPHNAKYNVGYYRVDSMAEFMTKLKKLV